MRFRKSFKDEHRAAVQAQLAKTDKTFQRAFKRRERVSWNSRRGPLKTGEVIDNLVWLYEYLPFRFPRQRVRPWFVGLAAVAKNQTEFDMLAKLDGMALSIERDDSEITVFYLDGGFTVRANDHDIQTGMTTESEILEVIGSLIGGFE